MWFLLPGSNQSQILRCFQIGLTLVSSSSCYLTIYLVSPYLRLPTIINILPLIRPAKPRPPQPLSPEELSLIRVKFAGLCQETRTCGLHDQHQEKNPREPELGFEEFETSKLIRAELDHLGIHYKHPIADTGTVGHIRTGGPTFVALRVDRELLFLYSNQQRKQVEKPRKW